MARAAPLVLAVAVLPQGSASPRPFETGVTVERVLVDARVLNRGRAVSNLGSENFRVRIDGRPAEVLSATWLSAESGFGRPVTPPSAGVGSRPPRVVDSARSGAQPERPHRRLVVFLVQKDLDPSRAPGMMHLLGEAGRFVERLGPEDRAAVLSFDRHLKLWQDFTSDPEELRRALEHDILFEERPRRVAPRPAPSLAARISTSAARRAASPETALLLVGEALRPISGSKTLVFLGWGLGELWGPALWRHPDYGPARRALLEAGVAVFTLDVTDADRHTLEAGLQSLAEDTGGFYARTHLFTQGVMARLEAALVGHYVLEVAHHRGRRGRHELRVDLVGRGGEVFARSTYFD